MVARRVLALLVLLLIADAAIGQTFQYSHGWTNGKRSEFPIAADMAGSADERFVNGDSKRLRMLLRGDADEQVSCRQCVRDRHRSAVPFIQSCSQPLLFHCDFVGKQRKLVHADDYALRRDKEQSDNNY